MLRAWIALSWALALTAGCAIEPGEYRETCDWAEPIRPSRADVLTEGTLAQIVIHNEIGERLCGWSP